MPIEVYEGKIDFADARHQLAKIKLSLAKIEGVENGDEATRISLTKEEGLLIGDQEKQTLTQKFLIQPIVDTILGFRGDGSQAAGLFGKRIELPPGDRGLIILALQTSDYLVNADSKYPTSSLLAKAFEDGITFDDIEKRMRSGMGIITSLVSKIPGQDGIKGDIEKETDKAMYELKTACGGTEQKVIANRPALGIKLTADIESRLNSNPQQAIEIRQDLAEMETLAFGNLRLAIKNAQGRLENIISSDPKQFDVSPALSPIGAYLVLDKAKREDLSFSVPEDRGDILDFIISAASSLQALDFETLAIDSETVKDQIARRTRILKGVSSVIKSPEDLIKIAVARRKEIRTLKKLDSKDGQPYYDQRPAAVAAVISFLNEQGKEQLGDDSSLGEAFAAAWAIVQESKQMMGDARGQAETILNGLGAKKVRPMNLKANFGRDKQALELLGLAKPTLPETVVTVSEATKGTLTKIANVVPDFWAINSFTSATLNDIYSGERLSKDATLEDEFKLFSLLVRANLPSE